MILSFHPCYVGDANRLCAGRDPDDADREAIRAADAVILPQGCRRSLFEAARNNCRQVFPDYAARFAWPGKTGQARLFEKCGAPHPKTRVYDSLSQFFHENGSEIPSGFDIPLVLKCNGSGEGANVWRIDDAAHFRRLIDQTAEWERTGQYGFILQEYIETGGKSLRVVVVGKTIISYWRMQTDSVSFYTGLSKGAEIDLEALPEHRAAAESETRRFCAQTGVNLAGFDLIFSEKGSRITPHFLEINYFFGRKGLGGSEAYYELLCGEIDRWIKESEVSSQESE